MSFTLLYCPDIIIKGLTGLQGVFCGLSHEFWPWPILAVALGPGIMLKSGITDAAVDGQKEN